MVPGNFLMLNIWVGSLFSIRVSAAFQIYFKCKSNNTNELRVEHSPRLHHSLVFLCLSAGRQGLPGEGRGLDSQEAPVSRGKKRTSAGHFLFHPCHGHRLADMD